LTLLCFGASIPAPLPQRAKMSMFQFGPVPAFTDLEVSHAIARLEQGLTTELYRSIELNGFDRTTRCRCFPLQDERRDLTDALGRFLFSLP
jgi:hypothetical protein